MVLDGRVGRPTCLPYRATSLTLIGVGVAPTPSSAPPAPSASLAAAAIEASSSATRLRANSSSACSSDVDIPPAAAIVPVCLQLDPGQWQWQWAVAVAVTAVLSVRQEANLTGAQQARYCEPPPSPTTTNDCPLAAPRSCNGTSTCYVWSAEVSRSLVPVAAVCVCATPKKVSGVE